MRSVGETMAIGRTFKEALQKGLRSLEIGRYGWGADGKDPKNLTKEEINQKLIYPNSQRIFYIKYALKMGFTIEEIHHLTGIDPWFLNNIKQILEFEENLKNYHGIDLSKIPEEIFKQAKEYGYSDKQLAYLWETDEKSVRKEREKRGLFAVYKLVDTCAAEFEAYTPYYYSTYEKEDEARISDKKKVMILGGGPNRIGQGIEFDYCCVHASFALKEEGIESIMVNSNPETVSTDYDTSDRLYFEPLTLEDVLNIISKEKPWGVIVQFGGQTPLNLSVSLWREGAPIIGTTPDSIDRAEDRERFKEMLKKLGLKQPLNGTAMEIKEAIKIAQEIGFPVLVRPSYVLGGRAMEIVYNEQDLQRFVQLAVEAAPGHPLLIDKFLEDAIEVDVDAVADGEVCVVAGIMEHIEEAGVHSGDSACVLPPHTLPKKIVEEIKRQTKALAKELNVIGLMNVQYAVKDGQVYVLEVNPRASRTVPFVSKATGIPWAKVATKVMLGKKLQTLGITEEIQVNHVAVKEVVLPFLRFPGVDPILGPEMRSTGEVMGIAHNYGLAYAKAQIASGQNLYLPKTSKVLITVADKYKPAVVSIAQKLHELGFKLAATKGTASYLQRVNLPVETVHKVREKRPHVVDHIKNHEFSLIINARFGQESSEDAPLIRKTALLYGVPYATTLAGAKAMVDGIEALLKGKIGVKCLQEYHKRTSI